jgi:sialidase-1
MPIEKQGGYSDLAVSADQRTVFCFFESGWIDGDCIYNESLALARIAVEELR